jgi:hypothetical protein
MLNKDNPNQGRGRSNFDITRFYCKQIQEFHCVAATENHAVHFFWPSLWVPLSPHLWCPLVLQSIIVTLTCILSGCDSPNPSLPQGKLTASVWNLQFDATWCCIIWQYWGWVIQRLGPPGCPRGSLWPLTTHGSLIDHSVFIYKKYSNQNGIFDPCFY